MPRPRNAVFDEVTGFRKWFIYCLKDPRNSSVRYVGYTAKTVEYRLNKHVYEAHRYANRYSAKWIMSMAREGILPVAETLESGTGDGWAESEKKWILLFKAQGCKLTNLTDGGEGVLGHKPRPETLAHLSRVNKGRTFTPEHREKLAAAKRGKKQSEAQIFARFKNRIPATPKSPRQKPSKEETARKISRALKGRTLSEEMKQHISKINRVIMATPEMRAKLSASHKGKKQSPELIAKRVASRKVHFVMSDEHKRKIGETNKRRWQERQKLATA